jgi:transposase-like protein
MRLCSTTNASLIVRSARNRTDSLCMVEVRDGRITRAFATVIPNKTSSTLLPIILANVAASSTVHTDEHPSYRGLGSLGFTHKTVCHKYEFVNAETGVNTQAISSFNNKVKLEIKRRKGILTSKREEFLREFVFFTTIASVMLKRS